MRYSILLEVEVERTSGEFAARDEVFSEIENSLNDANPQEVKGSEGGAYEVTDWTVSDVSEHVLITKVRLAKLQGDSKMLEKLAAKNAAAPLPKSEGGTL